MQVYLPMSARPRDHAGPSRIAAPVHPRSAVSGDRRLACPPMLHPDDGRKHQREQGTRRTRLRRSTTSGRSQGRASMTAAAKARGLPEAGCARCHRSPCDAGPSRTCPHRRRRRVRGSVCIAFERMVGTEIVGPAAGVAPGRRRLDTASATEAPAVVVDDDAGLIGIVEGRSLRSRWRHRSPTSERRHARSTSRMGYSPGWRFGTAAMKMRRLDLARRPDTRGIRRYADRPGRTPERWVTGAPGALGAQRIGRVHFEAWSNAASSFAAGLSAGK